jgi:Flp pilus assembly secretin CpaC
VAPANQVAVAEPALLHVTVREGRVLRTSENVVRVVSEHDRVCDVIQFNAREIALIGKQQGTVRVELWYDRQGSSRASYLVAVDSDPNTATEGKEGRQKIERLITYLFPESRVELVFEPDRLIVRGTAGNQRQAVEILSAVRRLQLIPVVDEIVVQAEVK